MSQSPVFSSAGLLSSLVIVVSPFSCLTWVTSFGSTSTCRPSNTSYRINGSPCFTAKARPRLSQSVCWICMKRPTLASRDSPLWLLMFFTSFLFFTSFPPVFIPLTRSNRLVAKLTPYLTFTLFTIISLLLRQYTSTAQTKPRVFLFQKNAQMLLSHVASPVLCFVISDYLVANFAIYIGMLLYHVVSPVRCFVIYDYLVANFAIYIGMMSYHVAYPVLFLVFYDYLFANFAIYLGMLLYHVVSHVL